MASNTITPDEQHLLRVRTSSLASRKRAFSSSTADGDSRPGKSVSPEIHSPTPRRHLLDSSLSQSWLNGTQPSNVSPSSSRAASPLSAFPATRSSRGLHSSLGRMSTLEPVAEERGSRHDGMGRRWIRWMHRRGIKHWVLPGIVAGSTLVKFCVGMGSFSGEGMPPMFGDYEAQRHWMELTIHLPISQWYSYDLQFWGLDYPPLTAYISWLCGIVGSLLEPSWFALDTSRGIETPGSKLYLRFTVLVLDAIFFVLPVIHFTRIWHKTRSARTQNLAVLAMLLQPSLLLIDFGHFQYNGVMLGLTLQAFNFFASGQDLLGAICFVLSLGFKQMALYYAPAIGTYLLAKCVYLGLHAGSKLFIHLGLVTVLTFVLLFLPFSFRISTPIQHLPSLPPSLLQPIIRIFPFNRGLFEDKVANFWCATNVVLKWRTLVSNSTYLVRFSTLLTATAFLPSVIAMLTTAWKNRKPAKLSENKDGGQLSPMADKSSSDTQLLAPLLPYALLSSSISFFLFSFQVHEKTILVPLLPMVLITSGALSGEADELFAWGSLVNNVAVFSMWPLLQKDGLQVQYVATLLLWNRLVGYNPFSGGFERLKSLQDRPKKALEWGQREWMSLLSIAVDSAAISLHVLEWLIKPPSRYPDLFPVLNVLLCTPIFLLTWAWSVKKCVEVSWAIGGLGTSAGGVASLSEETPASARLRTLSTISSAGGKRRPLSQQVFANMESLQSNISLSEESSRPKAA